MNSAEKKAPEPSMDDIISSIRNIIADDTQGSPAVQNAPTDPSAGIPVVQLTENQIAQPVAAQTAPEIAANQAPQAPMPQPAAAIEPAVYADPAPTPSIPLENFSAQIANQIDAVPGAALAIPNPQPPQSFVAAQTDPIGTIQTPNQQINTPQANIPFEAAPLPVAPAAVAPPLMPEAAPVASMAPEPALQTEPLVLQNSQIAGQPGVVAPQVPLVPSLEPIVDFGSTIETAIPAAVQSEIATASLGGVDEPVALDTAIEEVDSVNNGIDPDKILEGMDDLAGEPVAPLLAAENQVAVQETDHVKEPMVVLDASQVTPEDAAAISAVATATSEALAGRAEPVEENEGCKSLEDSVKAMLKPMIREWLDDNMPRILEGAIKEEVKSPGDDKA